MRFCITAVLYGLMAAAGPAAATGRPDIEIHAVADCADSIAPPQRDPQSHQEICVAPTMIVGGPDVIGVRDVTAQRGPDVLEVDLSEKASSMLFRYTSSRVRQRIAVLIDGKLIDAPIVLQPLMSRRLSIPGLSKQEIAAIVEHFKIGPPI